MKTKLLFFPVLALLLPLLAAAQDFQWAKRGGSTNTLQRLQDYNNVIEMATDGANNVYLLCYVGSYSLQVDGYPLDAYSSFGIGSTPDILLTSFTAQGEYRWSKVIGGRETDQAMGLKVHDGLIYLTGIARTYLDSAHYSTDTAVVYPNNGYGSKEIFLLQYDTTGTLQWLALPESDTLTDHTDGAFPYWIDVAPNGDVFWLCYLRVGALPNTSHFVNQEGTYVLRYSKQGQLLGRTKLDLEKGSFFWLIGNLNEGGFVRDHVTGRFYLGASYDPYNPFDPDPPLVIGGDSIEGSMYLAAFDSTGQSIWLLQDTGVSSIANSIDDIRLDSAGNLYVTGGARNGAVFNGYSIHYPGLNATTPFLMKLDAQANLLWGKTGAATAVTPTLGLTINGNEVAIAGYTYNLYFQGPNDLDTLKAVPNQGYDAYIARFDIGTGDLKGLESAGTNFGGASYGYSITADSEGSYYLGGNFDQQLFLGPDTLYKIGSQRSFFVVKYACNAPEAGFTVTNDSIGAFSFTYTGTEADSVLWDFGDGSPVAVGDSLSYLYTANGQFTVCATGYSYCGDTTYCETVEVSGEGLWEREASRFLTLAPNPARGNVRLHYGLSAMQGAV